MEYQKTIDQFSLLRKIEVCNMNLTTVQILLWLLMISLIEGKKRIHLGIEYDEIINLFMH